MSTCRPLFEKSYEIPFITVGRPHFARETSGFVSQSTLPGFVCFFFQTEQLCYHLPFAKWKNLERIVRVVLASETKSSAIFLKLTLVMATPLWLPNFPSLQNNSSSTWACGWALLSHFPLPWYLRHFVLEVRVSWDFLNSRPQIMMPNHFFRRRYLSSDTCIMRSECSSYSFSSFIRTSA